MASTLLSRFQQITFIKTVSRKLSFCFNKHLLVTNTGICIMSSGLGDLLQQRYEALKGRQKKWNIRRTANIGLTGLILGPPLHYWYIILDKMLPGHTVRIVAKKVICDQIIACPFFIVTFLGILRLREGANKDMVVQDIKDRGPTLFKAEFLVYPPIQAANFYLLPTKFRVLFDNAVSLGFDVFYSYVAFREKSTKDQTQIKDELRDSQIAASCDSDAASDDHMTEPCANHVTIPCDNHVTVPCDNRVMNHEILGYHDLCNKLDALAVESNNIHAMVHEPQILTD